MVSENNKVRTFGERPEKLWLFFGLLRLWEDSCIFIGIVLTACERQNSARTYTSVWAKCDFKISVIIIKQLDIMESHRKIRWTCCWSVRRCRWGHCWCYWRNHDRSLAYLSWRPVSPAVFQNLFAEAFRPVASAVAIAASLPDSETWKWSKIRMSSCTDFYELDVYYTLSSPFFAAASLALLVRSPKVLLPT